MSYPVVIWSTVCLPILHALLEEADNALRVRIAPQPDNPRDAKAVAILLSAEEIMKRLDGRPVKVDDPPAPVSGYSLIGYVSRRDPGKVELYDALLAHGIPIYGLLYQESIDWFVSVDLPADDDGADEFNDEIPF